MVKSRENKAKPSKRLKSKTKQSEKYFEEFVESDASDKCNSENSSDIDEMEIDSNDCKIQGKSHKFTCIDVESDSWPKKSPKNCQTPNKEDGINLPISNSIENLHNSCNNLAILPIQEPIEYFKLYFDDDIIDKILTKINHRKLKNHEQEEFKLADFEAYIGWVVATDINQERNYKEFWRNNKYLYQCISYLKFTKISSNLYMSDLYQSRCSFEPIKLLTEHLEKRFKKYSILGSQVILDKSNIEINQAENTTQYLRFDKARWGFKFFSLSDSNTGYIHRLKILVKKVKQINAGKMVLDLLDGYKPGIQLYLTERITSISLLNLLKTRQIETTGVIKPKRLQSYKDNLEENKNRKGFVEKNGTKLTWDRNNTIYISNSDSHSNPLQMIANYKRFIRNDQSNDCSIHYAKPYHSKWFRNFFVFYVAVAVHNAYVLYKNQRVFNNEIFKGFDEFRKEIVDSLFHTYKFAHTYENLNAYIQEEWWEHDTEPLDTISSEIKLNLELHNYSNTCEPGASLSASLISNPIDFFKLFITDDMIWMVTLSTNQTKPEFDKKANFYKHIKETKFEEIEAFFGALLLMRLDKDTNAQSFWDKNEFLSKSLSYKKFVGIRLIIQPNQVDKESKDKLRRIRPLWNLFEKNLKMRYDLGTEITINKSKLEYQSKDYGFKNLKIGEQGHKFIFYSLVDSNTGYVHKIEILRKEDEDLPADQPILNLLSGYEDQGKHLYINDEFTSLPFLSMLTIRGFEVTGMINYDTLISNGVNNGYIEKDYSLYLEDYNMLLTHVDKSFYISTDNDYTKKEGSEIALEFGQFTRERTKSKTAYPRFAKWWKNCLALFLEIAVNNAYILYKNQKWKEGLGCQGPHQFRKDIVISLCGSNTQKYRNKIIDEPKVADDLHMPIKSLAYKDCAYCKEKEPTKKNTTNFRCSTCDFYLHPFCFEGFHYAKFNT